VLNATHVTRPKLTLTSVSVREAARASAATIDLYYFEKASGMNASIIAELSSELASSTTWRETRGTLHGKPWHCLHLRSACNAKTARPILLFRRRSGEQRDGESSPRSVIADGFIASSPRRFDSLISMPNCVKLTHHARAFSGIRSIQRAEQIAFPIAVPRCGVRVR